jgi:lipopolysaccharide/colanic/teichoic acid biosynthesis glycosyltransferase
MHKSIYERVIKRMLDIIVSSILIILLAPVMLIIAIFILLIQGKPILFTQERPGLNEKIFTLYKFRTMRLSNDDSISDDTRLTRLGRLIRALSLDELPQLLNILKGDMSFVGPRPLLVKYLSLYNTHQKTRHLVRPGLTGLAQVSGRNALSWNEKFNLDVKYVESVRFMTDIKILFKTIIVVFKKTGISSNTSVTMEEFKGNE